MTTTTMNDDDDDDNDDDYDYDDVDYDDDDDDDDDDNDDGEDGTYLKKRRENINLNSLYNKVNNMFLSLMFCLVSQP